MYSLQAIPRSQVDALAGGKGLPAGGPFLRNTINSPDFHLVAGGLLVADSNGQLYRCTGRIQCPIINLQCQARRCGGIKS